MSKQSKPQLNTIARAYRVRLRRYQRRMSRQRGVAARRKGPDPGKPFPKGTRITPSMRMHRTRRKIGRLHAKVADTRRDFTHKLTHKLANTAEVICIEDLAVKAMSRGMGRRAFRRSVADAALGEIRRQVTYKAAWRGRAVSAVGRHYPSSKTCSGCGYKNSALKLKDRTWVCPVAGKVITVILTRHVTLNEKACVFLLKQRQHQHHQKHQRQLPQKGIPFGPGKLTHGEWLCAL